MFVLNSVPKIVKKATSHYFVKYESLPAGLDLKKFLADTLPIAIDEFIPKDTFDVQIFQSDIVKGKVCFDDLVRKSRNLKTPKEFYTDVKTVNELTSVLNVRYMPFIQRQQECYILFSNKNQAMDHK